MKFSFRHSNIFRRGKQFQILTPTSQNKISWLQLSALFIFTNLVYLFMIAVTVPMVSAHAGGMQIPDLMPSGYDVLYINSLFSELGADGRNAYLTKQLPVDMIYPIMFAVTYSLLLEKILSVTGAAPSYLSYVIFLPVISGFFDYLENYGIISMLLFYPGNIDNIAYITSLATILKSVFTTLTFVAAGLICIRKYLRINLRRLTF